MTSTTLTYMTRCESSSFDKGFSPATNCQVEAEYNRVLKFIHESSVKDAMMYFSRMPYFSGWTESSLRPFVAVTTLKIFEPGATILTQGQALPEMYFVKEGQW